MNAFIEHNLPHIVAGLAVLSRLADVGTTYLVTPTMKLEANAVARRLGWKYAGLTVLIGLIPYYTIPGGIIILTMSFLVAAANAAKIPFARVLGEVELAALSRKVMLATPIWPGLLFLLLPAILMMFLGGTMLLFYPDAEHDWGYYFAVGILAYALAMFVWYPIRFLRVKREAGAGSATS